MKKPRMSPKIGEFRLSQITPTSYNPRIIEMVAMEGLLASIERFGCVEPIVVNVRGKKNTIIGGHQRYKALVRLYGKDHRCPCVSVDLNKKEEKLLNLSLNNPKIQGEFIENINQYINNLRNEIGDEQSFLQLRMDQIQSELGADENVCNYKEEILKPYKKTHVLLSFPPHVLAEIADQLQAIMRIEEVEYEQCSN